MGHPMDVLAPNYMGDELQNSGIKGVSENFGMSSETENFGNGVNEVNKRKPGAPQGNESMEKLRRHKAREFGLTKETVGF